MCVVSFVGDQWGEHFKQTYYQQLFTTLPEVSKEEFDKLKKEVEFMKQMLIKAKLYDQETGQPDCEMEDKVKFIKEIAKKLGVDLKGIFDDKPEF